jgi:hypothetical protein
LRQKVRKSTKNRQQYEKISPNWKSNEKIQKKSLKRWIPLSVWPPKMVQKSPKIIKNRVKNGVGFRAMFSCCFFEFLERF